MINDSELFNDLEIVELLISRSLGEDWSETNEALREILCGLPEHFDLNISREEYQIGKGRRFGRSNPEVLEVHFWNEMIRCGLPSVTARSKFNDPNMNPPGEAPVWCFHRFGQSFNILNKGRVIEIGGEHEDWYDADFCIYNDVVVFDGKGGFTIFSYPREVFPPTDFHSATLIGPAIYIIGCLGYGEERKYDDTPVYELDTRSMAIRKLETTGEKPGWIHRHQARIRSRSQIVIRGGKVCQEVDGKEEIFDNSAEFVLDLETLKWRKQYSEA